MIPSSSKIYMTSQSMDRCYPMLEFLLLSMGPCFHPRIKEGFSSRFLRGSV